MVVELVVSLPTVKKGDFTNRNQTVEYKALVNYFPTLDSVQKSKKCIYFFDAMPLVATG